MHLGPSFLADADRPVWQAFIDDVTEVIPIVDYDDTIVRSHGVFLAWVEHSERLCTACGGDKSLLGTQPGLL